MRNTKSKISQKFREITKTKIFEPPYVGVEWEGGGLVQPWRILHANTDCTLFVFPLYCFPFFHSVIYNSMTSPYTEGLVVTGMNREFKNVQFKIKKLLACAVLYIMFTLYSHFIFLDKRKIT